MTDRLAAEWMRRADIVQLVEALGRDNARFVGGAVRDELLGLPVKDIDMATTLLPQDVIARLDDAGMRNVPTGIEHGTVTAVLPGGPVEITTLRHDVSTDGRRATVAFASEWRDDAARRDFTINALYADPESGEIFDFFGGLHDLRQRTVRFIGDARQRIREDHLRILRYFRFQARFGSQPADQEAEEACAELAATLKGLSRERIGMETMNLLGLAAPSPTLRRMAELGVLAVILPEADPEALTALVAAERSQGIAPDALRRLAALLPAQVPLAEQVASRFRLSGAQKKRLATAAARTDEPVEPRALAYRLGIEGALDRLLIAGADASSLDHWVIPQFPLKGGEIVGKGVGAGPEVARILRSVEDCWIAEGFPDKARVDALLDAELADRAA
ncbi:CCA tRNA nucleotidyltransferase [Novosphingobium pentaromativorans]|uniref:Poly(A) polymerase n=1 Tax=Novosphingobium pentaromativorans US6-1 TaxID=1088721 RepID=G6EID6_9SPHN|nr:CCA tRNA nucleotidyltransferase [Novosphingobium pentaromativorans]AIT78761.1 polynucleotide adenylyltransferase [Novosphingobium pentaromativorans US6-1]EHJ58878.1 poly(A) polymerase [Novosphingobium pentaromativorans US6-1]